MKRLLALVFVVALVAAACGDDDDGDSAEAEGAADLQLASSDLGDILVDADGNTIYL